MAKSTITLNYSGRAEKPIEWAALLRIFDTVCGPEARSLRKWPEVIGATHASWHDASGVEYEAESLDEVGHAYQKHETVYISFRRLRESGSHCSFSYWPARAEASIEVRMGDQMTAERYIAAVRKEFPLTARHDPAKFDIWSLMHPDVIAVARSRFDTGHFADAVEAAFKHFNATVKKLAGSGIAGDLDGAPLMNRVFSPNNPIIKLSDLSTATGKNIQNGYMQMFAGAMTGIRNPKAHENITIDANRATHLLFVASLFLYKLAETTSD